MPSPVVVDIVVGRVVVTRPFVPISPVVVGVVVGRVVVATVLHLDFRRGAASLAVAVDGVIGTATPQA